MKIFQSINSPFYNSPLRDFLRDENGATAIEYAMIAAGIGVAIASTVMAVGPKVSDLFQRVISAWPT
jgi:pilus assembly protein Flp/PilA